ncbi:TPA: class II aldolase/adducin family protein, partial [Streptococcus pneumoniae]|nr:class II aldolase/adducin family protein [Streptococcus pneumoniae]
TLERLFSMRENYKVTGRHPGYRKYNGDGSMKETEK